MGIIIPSRKFSSKTQQGLMKPIVFCCSYEGQPENVVSLNLPLAQALLNFKPKRRTMQIEKCLLEILKEHPDGIVIKDFDVLFNPDYKIDVLKILANLCRVKPFSIIWPGIIDGDRLIYSEERFSDYKTYCIDDYDITCII